LKKIENETTLYYPLEPELFTSKIKKDFDVTIDSIHRVITKLYYKKKQDYDVLVIKGRDKILDFLNLLITRANKKIILSVWEQDLKHLKKSLDEIVERNVKLKGIFFGKNNPYRELVIHRRTERVLYERRERYIFVIIDGEQVVSGIISKGEESQVTWTKDKGFVEMSQDYILHDISLNILLNRLKDNKEEYEKFLDDVRKEYMDLE